MKATTQSEMVNNAVRKPGQAQMTMKIMRIAQRIIPIMVVLFWGCYCSLLSLILNASSNVAISVFTASFRVQPQRV